MLMGELLWLTEERCFAEMVTNGAHCSIVKYTREGIDYEVIVDNDEFTYFGGDASDDED